MALSALPAELKLNTIQYLDPESTFHFALTCKEHATISRSVLEEHAKRLSEGQVFDTTWGTHLLWRFLLEVLEDPSAGWYVRELNLPLNRQSSWTDPHRCAPDAPSEEDKKEFARAAQQLQSVYTPTTRFTGRQSRYPFQDLTGPNDMVGTILHRIEKGFEDGVIAILIHHLPFLQTIRITDVDTAGLEFFVRRIADEYSKPSRSPKLPLRHLKTAAVAHGDTEMGCSPDWAVSFCDIPSLTTFVAQNMANNSYFVTKDVYDDGQCPRSNGRVTELFLYASQLSVENGLVPILANIKNLRKFTYSAGGATVSDSEHYCSKRVIRELLKNASHSLEELILDQGDIGEDLSDEMDIPTISLRGFQRLRILNIEYELLRPLDTTDDVSDEGALESGFYTAEEDPTIDDAWDVRTILPESLEELYMHGAFDNDDGGYDEWEQVKDMFAAPSAVVPKLGLEKVCIWRRRYAYSDDVIGTAVEPGALYEAPLVQRLFEGHGY